MSAILVDPINQTSNCRARHDYHLECGDVTAHVDGMPAGVSGMGGRALGYRHGEQEGLLATCVHGLVVHLHSVEQLLRGTTELSRRAIE